jgi:hypothetical protein
MTILFLILLIARGAIVLALALVATRRSRATAATTRASLASSRPMRRGSSCSSASTA